MADGRVGAGNGAAPRMQQISKFLARDVKYTKPLLLDPDQRECEVESRLQL
jgi:hypothetical protein